MENRIPTIALISTFYIFGLSTTYGIAEKYQIYAGALICFGLILLCIFNKIKPVLCIILCIMFFGGFYNAKMQDKNFDDISEIQSANSVTITGRISTIPSINSGKKNAKFFLDVQKIKIFNKILSTKNTKVFVSFSDLYESYKSIKIGNIVKIKGNLRQPAHATNPSEFDYKNYLKHKDTFCILYSDAQNQNPKNIGYIKVLSHPNIKTQNNPLKELPWFILQNIDNIRNEILLKHNKYIKSPNLEVLGGIVFGDDAVNPPDEIKQSFINSGLLHLLAASGLNVALIFGIWWSIGGLINLGYKTKICSGIGIILFYTFMTGFGPSIVRAGIMLILILIGKLMFKAADNLALIFFTGFIMLLINPKLINDVGFQLSFLVTGGLITCIEPICSNFKNADKNFKKKIFKKFKNCPKIMLSIINIFSPISLLCIALVPLVAQLWAAPLQMYYFNTFTPYSVLANIAIVPFIGIISFLGFTSSIAGYFFKFYTPLSDFIIKISSVILNPLITLLLNISDYFSRLPGAIIKMPSGNVLQIAIYYTIILLLAYSFKSSFKHKLKSFTVPVLIFIFLCTFINVPNQNCEVIAFDVGNADNLLIKTPKNKYIMIDTGKLPYNGISTAKRVTLEYLYDKNIRTLEKLVITHFDNDHSGGTIDILENIKVKEVIIQDEECNTENFCAIKKYLKENKTNVKNAQNDNIIYKEKNKADEFTIKTFTPKPAKGARTLGKYENETSTIVLIQDNTINNENRYLLFMADGGVQAFKSIKNQLPKGITLLKAGHHGAKNVVDEEMLKHLKPEYTIISTGFNTYGHPSPETIKILKESGSKIYPTKDFGAIKFSFNKNGKTKICTFSSDTNCF